MKFRIQVLRVAVDGAERMKEVMEFERQELAMETLEMSLAEGKAVLKGVQEFVAEQQAAEFLQRERTCRPNSTASYTRPGQPSWWRLAKSFRSIF